MPRRAAAANAARIAVGLASRSADGQATTSTVTAVIIAWSRVAGSSDWLIRNHTIAAMLRITGTKNAETDRLRGAAPTRAPPRRRQLREILDRPLRARGRPPHEVAEYYQDDREPPRRDVLVGSERREDRQRRQGRGGQLGASNLGDRA